MQTFFNPPDPFCVHSWKPIGPKQQVWVSGTTNDQPPPDAPWEQKHRCCRCQGELILQVYKPGLGEDNGYTKSS